MTLEEQKKSILERDLICLGPCIYDEKTMRGLFDAWYKIEKEGIIDNNRGKGIGFVKGLFEETKKLAKKVSPKFQFSIPEVFPDDWEGLRRMAFPLMKLRTSKIGKPCGHNMAFDVVEHPFDGSEHKDECPNCGNKRSWRSPVFYNDEG